MMHTKEKAETLELRLFLYFVHEIPAGMNLVLKLTKLL